MFFNVSRLLFSFLLVESHRRPENLEFFLWGALRVVS